MLKTTKAERVLHLIDSAGMYGAERVVLTLLDELKDSEFPGILGCIRESETEIPQIAKDALNLKIQVELFTMRRGLNLSGIRRILGYIRSNNIRLVHSHGYKSNIFLGILLNRKFKTISTVHGWAKNTAGMKARVYEFLDALSLNRMNAVVAVSKAVINDLLKGGIKREKISLIYNGIAVNLFKSPLDLQKIRQKYGFNEDDFVIGAVGRLTKVKGHSYLIEAMPSILKETIKCKIIIAGEGPLREYLMSLVEKHNLSSKVKLIGYTKQVEEILSMIDLFVLPSLSEGLPISLLEAMAHGKPVLASAVGGIPEVISDENIGVLVPPADSVTMAESIIRLSCDQEKMARIAVVGKKHVEKIFSSEYMAREYLNLYSSYEKY